MPVIRKGEDLKPPRPNKWIIKYRDHLKRQVWEEFYTRAEADDALVEVLKVSEAIKASKHQALHQALRASRLKIMKAIEEQLKEPPMDEAIQQTLKVSVTDAQAYIIQEIQEDPALKELATQVVITALTRTLGRLKEGS